MDYKIAGPIMTYLCHICALFLLSDSKYSLKKTIAIWSVVLGACSAITAYIAMSDSLNVYYNKLFFITIAIYCIAFFWMDKGSFLKKLFVFTTYSNLFFVFFLTSYILSRKLCGGSEFWRIVIRTTLYIGFFLFYTRYVKKRFTNISFHMDRSWGSFTMIAVLFLTLFTYTIVYPVSIIEYTTFQDYLLFLLILVLMFCVYLVIFKTIYYINKMAEMKQMELKNQFFLEQAQDYEQMAMDARRTRHDFRHHNLVVMEYAKNKDYDNLIRYLSEYEENAQSKVMRRFCANKTVNNILTVYARKAGMQSIELHMKGTIPEEIPINEADMVAILANILENAMHGCIHSKAEKQVINLFMTVKHHKLVISCKNTCASDICLDGGIPKSKHGRGIGISSILEAVKKYGGETDFSVNNNIFTCRILINLH